MSTPESLKGIIPPMITPLNEDFSLDVEHTIRMIQYLIQGEMNGVFILELRVRRRV